MKPNNVIANLNRQVRYTGHDRPELKGKSFKFTGATIRRSENRRGIQGAPFYQAELQESASRALVIVNLNDIEVLEE